MGKLIPIFSGTSGINTKLDPARLRFNPEAGISELAASVNCDIDDTGRIFRREGTTATIRTEKWKNLFSCGSYGIGTKDDALCIIEPNIVHTAIRNITPYARMSYVRDTDGTQDVIYYCNGYEKGRVISKVSHSWPASSYVGPETRKTFQDPPIGHLLETRSSRMFIGRDNVLWYSEPGAMSLFRLAANYLVFPSRLKMLQAVDEGLWISDSESIYFLGGEIMPTALEMPRQTKKADYPAREGTAVKVKGSKIGDGLKGMVIVFTTEKDICLGTSDGQLLSLTEKKIDLPSGLTGAGLYKDGKYIVTID